VDFVQVGKRGGHSVGRACAGSALVEHGGAMGKQVYFGRQLPGVVRGCERKCKPMVAVVRDISLESTFASGGFHERRFCQFGKGKGSALSGSFAA